MSKNQNESKNVPVKLTTLQAEVTYNGCTIYGELNTETGEVNCQYCTPDAPTVSNVVPDKYFDDIVEGRLIVQNHLKSALNKLNS